MEVQTPYPWADALRLWVLVSGSGVLGLTLAIGYWYVRDYAGKMRDARTPAQRRLVRATTVHVWSIVASYTVLTFAALIETYLVVREPVVWYRGPFYAVAFPAAIYALWTILVVIRKRVHEPTGRQ